jgi:hypothetical protein
LLKELLHDAERRGGKIAAGLRDLAGQVPGEVEAYREKMLQRVEHAVQHVGSLLADPDLEQPLYATSYFREYKVIARLIQALENVALLVLKRYTEPDRKATVLMAAICRDVNFPFAAPICSSVSSQFYWTMPDMDVVFVPCLEPDHLLGLPDIYHELGHILQFREKSRFVLPGLSIVDRCYHDIIAEGKKQNWPVASLDEVERFRDGWRQAWLLEFGSDLIASYLVGPAFGWCNIRTSTNLGGELFTGSESHPADDARAKAIGVMLKRIGCLDAAAEIQARWDELVALSNETAPHRYDLAYPATLLSELAKFFDSECHALGLRRYASSGSALVSTAVNDAWREFRERPDQFGDFEQQRLAALFQVIGGRPTP